MPKINRNIDLRNLVRELASNKVDALELVRETLSNARDHDAKSVWFRSSRHAGSIDLLVANDGEGMSPHQLEAFWGVSASVKAQPGTAIGYKGHGSKLLFSCQRLSVVTRRSVDAPWMLTTMDDPLASKATEVDEEELPQGHLLWTHLEDIGLRNATGVAIHVERCRFHDAERFVDRRAIESYCDWFTVVGDIRSGLFKKREEFHDFIEKARDLEQLRATEAPLSVLTVRLRIGNEPSYLPLGFGTTKPANSHLSPWNQDVERWKAAARPGMAAFGHRFADHFESDGTAGVRRIRDDRTALCLVPPEEFSSDPHYGLVLRVEGQRRQLDSYPEGSRQPIGGEFDFDQRLGLWLCKDFIPAIQRNDLLTRALVRATEKSKKRLRFDLSKTRFWQVFVNCQNFVLTANRNGIANTSQHDEKIVELVATRIAETLREDAFREWIENLQRAVTAGKKSKELDAMRDRVDSVVAWFKKPGNDVEPTQSGLELLESDASLRLPRPTNEQELFYLYAILSGRFRLPLRIIEYDCSHGVDAVAQVQTQTLFEPRIPYARVEFKFTLQGNRSIGHFFDAIDAMVCWSVVSTGDLPEAGDSPTGGTLRKRKEPKLAARLDSHEIVYTDDKMKERIIPVLVMDQIFAPKRKK